MAIHDCWCVDENGVEKEGSRIAFAEDIAGVEAFDCDKPTEAPFVVEGPCAKERVEVIARNQMKQAAPRSFFSSAPALETVPTCKDDGFYESVQCDNRGTCWCLTTVGNEIPGTRVNTRGFFAKPKPNCNLFQDGGPCARLKTQANFPTHLQCDQDGYYEEVQCMTPTNCYCVDKLSGNFPKLLTCFLNQLDSRSIRYKCHIESVLDSSFSVGLGEK